MKIKNFYMENEKYLKLDKKLKEYNLEGDLLVVVGEAVMYGMEKMEETVREAIYGRQGNCCKGKCNNK